jgi:hypothetical protein
MATTTNYGWTTPDDTALVKDGAAAIRTLGSSVDTTTKNLNPETTLGDLAYRSSTANVKTRLGLGTAGQVLQVNSGATAPEWAAPATGLNLITPTSIANSGGTATLSGAVTTATGVSSVSLNGVFSSTYLNYIIEYNELSGSTTLQSYMRLRASGSDNTSSTYSCGSTRTPFSTGSPSGYSDSNASFWTFNVNTDTRKVGSPIFINSPFVAVETTFSTTFSGGDNGGFMAGNHSTASAFDGFTIYPSTGTISGIFRVYGISN